MPGDDRASGVRRISRIHDGDEAADVSMGSLIAGGQPFDYCPAVQSERHSLAGGSRDAYERASSKYASPSDRDPVANRIDGVIVEPAETAAKSSFACRRNAGRR